MNPTQYLNQLRHRIPTPPPPPVKIMEGIYCDKKNIMEGLLRIVHIHELFGIQFFVPVSNLYNGALYVDQIRLFCFTEVKKWPLLIQSAVTTYRRIFI